MFDRIFKKGMEILEHIKARSQKKLFLVAIVVGQQAQGNARLVRNFLEGGFGIAKLTKQFLGRFKKSFLFTRHAAPFTHRFAAIHCVAS